MKFYTDVEHSQKHIRATEFFFDSEVTKLPTKATYK